MQAQGLVEQGFEVLEVLQLLEGWELVVERGDVGLQRGEDVRAVGQGVPDVGEEGGGGVAAGEEDVEELGADLDGVGGLADELVEEDVAARLVGVGFLLQQLRAPGEALLDIVVDEIVHEFLVVLEVLVGGEEGAQAAPAGGVGDEVLAAGEALGEAVVAALGEGLGALAEEELGGAVDGEAEEELAEVDGAAVFGHGGDKVSDVLFEGGQVTDLGAGEVGTEHFAAVLPGGAVGGEDAVAEEGAEGEFSTST